MRRFIALLFTLIPIFTVMFYQRAEIARAPANEPIKHIIFDLDGTLVESLGFGVPGDVVLDNGEAYRIFPHARELVEKAWQQGLQIHFFSGGDKARNDELLSKIELPNGQSFAQLATSIHSREDLTDLGEQAAGQYFTDRYRKDLSKVAPLEELVIFEDNKYFPLNLKQRKRVLELPVHSEGALSTWWKEQRLAWAYQALVEVMLGKSPSEVNHLQINRMTVKGMQALHVDAKKELSRHGCAGIFYALSL